MELYIMDSLLRRTHIIDRYKSLIWTERFQAAGDFELVIESTSEYRRNFTPGTFLSLDRSYRLMRVETVVDKFTEEGDKVLTISGSSLEILLDERTARQDMLDLATTDILHISDQPHDAIEQIVDIVCVLGALDPADIIPFLTVYSGEFFPTENIPFPTDSVVNSFDVESLYQAIIPICEAYDMGFRLCLSPNATQLVFDVYMGSDRTTNQEDFPAVVFSPHFDNLRDTNELVSNAGSKNVAYVFSPVGYEIVLAPNVDPDISGFDRKVLTIRADDIDDTVPADATAKMIQRGLEELAKHRDISAFDGEVGENSQYLYDTDYHLGDIIEMRSIDGDANFMRVTEQIFVSDEEGVRSYPTLTSKKLVSPDSWLGWPNITWEDLDGDPLEWEDA